jgi:SprT-like family
MAKTKTRRSIARTKKADAPITVAEYSGLQQAFDFLNTKLFDGALPNVVILLQRRAYSGGHFAPDRFTSRAGASGGYHEISLNPDGFIGQTDLFIISILLHEMTHLWQQVFGKPPSRNYHDRQWSAKMDDAVE